jgi:hypothetical protein
MNNAEETAWWQEMAEFAYCLDGMPSEEWRPACQRFLDKTPMPDPRGSLEDFKRYAAMRLIEVVACGPDPHAPNVRERLSGDFFERLIAEQAARPNLRVIDGGRQ